MQIIEKKLSEIRPYERNPRKNGEAVKYVANSIEQFGFRVPIVIDNSGTIVCGHTRYAAAKRLKLKTVPCVTTEDLTEEQIRAFRIADNKVSEFSEWDSGLLPYELEQLSGGTIDMTDFGFDLPEWVSDQQINDDDEGVQQDDDGIQNIRCRRRR